MKLLDEIRSELELHRWMLLMILGGMVTLLLVQQ